MKREAEQQRETEVGGFLRTNRLRAGLTLSKAASVLCIREAYLKAIEDGRFGDLPGPTYVTGFIRTYSEHLGLDGNEVVRQLKAEPLSMDGNSELRFPSPMSEGGMPSGAILLIGLFVALVAYGAWYVSSSRDERIAELISPLPERLVAILHDGDDTTVREGSVQAPGTPETSQRQQTDPDDGPAASDRVSPATSRDQEQVTNVTGNASGQTVPAAPSDSRNEDNAGDQAEIDSEPVVSTSAETIQGDGGRTGADDSETAIGESFRINNNASGGVEDRVAIAPPPASAGADTQTVDRRPVESEPASTEEAVTPLEGRIVLRAKGENWVEIREGGTDRLVVARLFKPGDTFDVPDTPGLRLLTGNAGGLEILVDGKPVPPLGTEGMVRRNIPLDAEQLRSGGLARN